MVSINEVKVNPIVGSPRMVVFVPERLENIADFARQIYLIAVIQKREVFYLALNNPESQSYAAARQLATLTALTQDQVVRVCGAEAKIGDWTETLREFTRSGDLVIWPDERLLVPSSLERELGITQQALPDVYAPLDPRAVPWYRPVIFWLAVLAITAGFSFLEYSVQGVMSGASSKVMMILLFALECGALYQWNRIYR